MAYELPPLPYPKDALEPHIDAMTMEIHHGKHHAAYVANVNKAIAGGKTVQTPDEVSAVLIDAIKNEGLKSGVGFHLELGAKAKVPVIPIAVYADWDGLRQPLCLGLLHIQRGAGREVFEFEFDAAALAHPALTNLQLDPRLGR
jgi:hypothetical protein